MLASKALELFHQRMAAFGPTRDHFVPDLALRGFLHEIDENATVALSITTGPLPHRAYPSARAAFESSQLALLLATSSCYDEDGAKAWVFDLYKDQLFVELHPGATQDGLTPPERFEAACEEIASMWDDLAAGKGRYVREVIPWIRNKPKKPDNWAGVSVGKTLGERLERMAQVKGVKWADAPGPANSRAYAALSRSAHPRPSLRPIQVNARPDGYLRITLEKRDEVQDRTTMDALIAGAVNFGIAAINARQSNVA